MSSLKQIKYVQFSPLTNEQLQNYGILINRQCIHGSQGLRSYDNTPSDDRLGILENTGRCKTCGMTNINCSGHFGYIPLHVPVFNPKYIQFAAHILKCVCFNCGELLLQKFNPVCDSGFAALKSYRDQSEKVDHCTTCSHEHHSIIFKKNVNTIFKSIDDNLIKITAADALRVFEKISNETLRKLGLNAHLTNTEEFKETIKNITMPKNFIHPHQFRPEALIFQSFPVIPPQARPYVIQDDERKEDDLTDNYSTIVKINEQIYDKLNNIPKKKNEKKSLDDYVSELERLIGMIIDNKNAKVGKKANERKIKGLTERISGKHGHIQSNAGGKRSDQSARDVIVSAGPTLKMNEVGVPESIAKTLTKTELITSWNLKYYSNRLVKKCVTVSCETCNGYISSWNNIDYFSEDEAEEQLQSQLQSQSLTRLCFACNTFKPKTPDDVLCTGCISHMKRCQNMKTVLKTHYEQGTIVCVNRGGNVSHVKILTKNFTVPFSINGDPLLREGDYIERHLQDGDAAVFNRQPTISIESAQGISIKVLRHGELAFQLPVQTTRAYNADYDGDEMNLHVIQLNGAKVEARVIMNTANQIVSRQGNAPVMGSVQNTLIGMYLLTLDETSVSYPDFCDLMCEAHISLERVNDLLKRAKVFYGDIRGANTANTANTAGTELVPGKVLASIVFPKTFSYNRSGFKVVNGIITPDSAPMTKKSIGGTTMSCVHVLWKPPYSPSTSCQFVSELQYIGSNYIWKRGFSMGASDCLPVDHTIVTVAKQKALLDCEIIEKSSKSAREKEVLINGALNKAMEIAPVLAKDGMNKGKNNSLVIMKVCGAKGSDINNGQISGFVGQQNIDGSRAPKKLNGGTRCLPHFKCGDNLPYSRGFVGHSYMDGLTPTEMWFHSISGRRGVIDTHQKTAESGYISKKMNKKLEDCVQDQNGAVYDTNKNVVTFLYGGDGMNAKHLVNVNYGEKSFPFFVEPVFVANYVNSLYEASISEPSSCGGGGGTKRLLTDDEINELNATLLVGCYQTEVTKFASYNIHTILKNLLKDPQVLVYEEAIYDFMVCIQNIFEQSKSPSGESVGLIAGFSMGQPTTQMTLNTFQAAGVSAKDVTLGIPRLRELVDATKKPSKKSCSIYLKNSKSGCTATTATTAEEVNPDDEMLDMYTIAEKFVGVKFGELIEIVELKFVSMKDENGVEQNYFNSKKSLFKYSTFNENDYVWIKSYCEMFDVTLKVEWWVIDIQVNVFEMYKKDVTLSQICDKITQESPFLTCIPSPLTHGRILIFTDFNENTISSKRVQLSSNLFKDFHNTYITAREIIIPYLRDIHIQGIKEVTKAVPSKEGEEWIINTSGCEYLSIMSYDHVDTTRTICDDVHEIYNVLGVEASTRFLLKEITKVMCFDGTYINSRHITLLVDMMTKRGTITSIAREGIKDTTILTRGMFEQPVDNFVESSVFCDHDPATSMSASIMLGLLANTGINTVKVVDVDTLPVKRK